MFVKKSHTCVQSVNLTDTYRNSYRLPLHILQILQKYSNYAKCNSNVFINKPNPLCRLKSTKVGEEEKKAAAVVKYKKQPNSLKIWKFGELRTALRGFTSKPIQMKYDALKSFYMALKRDAILSQRYLKSRLVYRILAANDMSLGECFDAVAELHSNDVMIYFEDTKWTYKQVEILANKITNYFLSLNYEKGDVVAMLVTNRPEYLVLVLGLSKIGVISALIDTHFKADSLLHAIQLADCKGLIVSDDLLPEFNKVKNQIYSNIELFQLDGLLQSTNFKNLADMLIVSPDQTPEIIYKVNQSDPLVYIYTFSDSGSPHAAMLSHSKFIENSIRITYLLNLTMNDIIYDPLPLYQTTGLTGGTGPSIIFGVPVVIRRHFSATKYWSDCRKYKCTVGQYAGDICKNLLLQPLSPDDQKHNLKKMLGSGLHKDMWKEFVQRFKVEVAELYGTPEGHTDLIDSNGQIIVNSLTPSILPKFLRPVSNDLHTLEPLSSNDTFSLRNGEQKPSKMSTMSVHGFYINSVGNETNNLGEVSAASTIANPATNINKLKGSVYWKGETVTIGKIESVINYLTRPSLCAVYTVSIPNTDGKAGMAVIADPQGRIDLQTFAKQMKKYLPNTACPVFIRLAEDPNSLLTVQDRKHSYADEGFDPTKIKDKLYYIDEDEEGYKALTQDVYQKIIERKITF